MSKNSQVLAQFTPYIQALNQYYKCTDNTTVEHRSSCKGVGGGGFNIIEKGTGQAPKLICGIAIDKLHPNPPEHRMKCDNVFIILHAADSTTMQLQYCCFVELKKGSDLGKAYTQILNSIKEFREAFQKYAQDENGKDIELPKQKIIGLIGGGINKITQTDLNNKREEFKKKHGTIFTIVSGKIYILPN